MVSFDVESLFTNIPLEESIDLAVEYIFKGIPNFKITHDYLKKLFFIATSQTHFLFDGSFYDHIDGVAMGSPLAPVLANLFMGHHEMKWPDTFPSEILFYQRYVDDTFCLFHTESDALLFFDFINSRHPNIRFTMEAESDKKLPFLDIYVDNTGPMVVTRVFRKKTFTGLLTCFFSFASFSYKIGLVKTLVDRTLKICNTWQAFDEDIVSLTFILKKNLYPSRLIERIIKRSVTKHVTGNSVRSTSEQAPNTFYFKLPYIGYFSSIAQKCIRRLSHFYCNNANIVLAFSSFKVGSLSSVKDPVPNGLRSCVVYKFSCAGCAACYVSETTQHFNTRVREHLETDRASHIFKHLESSSVFRSACSRDNFAIIDQASSWFALKIKEALHILFSWDKPTLNAQVKHVNLKLSV